MSGVGSNGGSSTADIFSFGVTMVYCLTGRYPFKRITAKLKSGKKMNMSAIYKHFGPPDDMLMRVASLDRRFIKMVRMCFKFRPEERPTATQLRAILREH
jgi:serine/threonine protein kinase